MSSYRKLAKKQALRLSMAIVAMTGGMTGWMATAHADGETNIQKADTANAGTITTSGNVWTVVPDKIEGDIATNAFSHFTLNQNNIANLRLYNSSATANKLVNLVSDSIDIRGTVNVLKNANTIGGDVFFLSKSGMAVGRTGVINAGSITALTPSVEWFDQHLTSGRAVIAPADIAALESGKIPLNADGSIVIDGALNAQSGIHLRAPQIEVGAAGDAAVLQSKANLDFSTLVNIGSVSAGLGTLTATTGTKGDIVLEAAANQLNSTTNDVPKHTNTGSGSQNEIKAELTVGESAKVTGDRNITLSSYAEHSADENNVFGSTNSNTSAKLLGQSVKTTAHTTVNGKVTADGRLSVTAEAKNEASEKSGLTKSGPGLDFLTEVAGTLSVNVAPSYMVMSSEAKTKIGAAAVLTAKGTDEMDGSTLKNRALTVGADARVSVDAGATTSKIKVANVAHTNAVPAMAVGYVNAQSAADVTVEGNLKAEQGSADVHAKSHEDLQAAVQAKTTQVAAGADSTQIMNAAVLIARGSNTAQTKIAGNAVIDANKETNIISHTRTNLNTSATAAGKENSLLNAVVNVTKQDSAAHTEIQGSVKGGAAVHIRADNEQLKNIVQASTAVGSSAASTQFTNAALETNSVSHIIHGITRNIGEFRKKIGFPSDGLSSPTALDTLAQKVSLGGAINVVNETQRADVVLAPKATIHSNGAVGIAANSTVQGTRVQAQSAVNNNTNPDWYLTPDGKAGKVKPGQTEETQGMGSFAVNVVNIKNTASVTTLAAEEPGTAHAPEITGKTVDIKSDAHFRYTNIEEMVGELLKSCDAVKTHCSNAGINSDKVSAVRDKAAAYRDKCRNDAGYIMSEEGLKEAKELADAIVEMGKFIKEAVGASNIFSNALAFADPSNYMTFQASAKFSGKTASQGKPDVEQAKIAGAAGVNFVDVDNNAAVVLGRGTQVTATEAVTVAADSTKRLVTLAGAPAWQAGADVALGGNVGITLGDTTADVIVAEGVQIRGESAEIEAKNRYDGIHLAIAAGKGGKVGFQGMANYVGGTSGAVTSVDDEAQITTDKAAKITAANTTNITNIAGSAVLGAGGAVGLSAALNNVAQTSVAAIANNDVAAEQQEAKTAEQRTAKALQQAQKRAAAALRNANGTAVSAGDLYGTAEKTLTGAVQAETLAVRAEQQGVVNAVAAAGAVSTGNDSSEKGGFIDKVGAVKENAQTKLGNLITLVDNKLQGVVKSPLNKLAAKDTIPMDAVKNLGFNQKQPSLSLDLAGSASVNISKVTTAAEMSGANVTLTKHASSSAGAKKNLTVSAQDSSFTGAWGGSMAIAWKTSQQSQNQGSTNVGIAGAVSVNEQKHRDVLALMAGNTIKGADSIENGAVQKGATVAAALGLALTKASSSSATSTAVPISLTYNNGGSVTSAQMRDNYVNAEANGTPITGTQKTDIANRAVSSNTQVSGGISTAVVTGSQSSNAVGVVVAVSNLKNDVSADITQTRRNTGALRSVGTLRNEALSGMTQIGAAIGVGVASGSSSSKAVTGSFAVNNFENKAGAHLTNVTLTADSASVRADDKKAASDYANYLKARGIETSGDKYQEDFAKGNSKSSLAVDEHGNLTHNGGSTIVTAAASISAAVGNGSSTAAGLGIGIGLIKNDFEAEVKGSDLDIRGTDGLNVESVADTRVVNVAVGAAGGSGFSAAGSASVIKTENKTSALVENSDIKAQKLTVNALTKTLLVNVAGQVSVSTGGAGVAAGLATAVNILDNDTAAARAAAS